MCIALRTNDGRQLIVDGYDRSAYGVFSYASFFDGDDGPAVAFMDEWQERGCRLEHIQPNEGCLVVDFQTRRILIDIRQNTAGIDRTIALYKEDPLAQAAVAQGRATLPRSDGAGVHVISQKALNDAKGRGIVSFIHGKEIDPDGEWEVDSTFHIDFAPWTIGYHPNPLAPGNTFFDEIRSCGFEADPELWRKRDEDDEDE
jgi:hypothetical protein